jgi:uroporphyrinogen III methyltransferase/synthase
MGVERLRHIAQRLIEEGAARETPVALVRWGTTARQETLEGTLETVADLAEARGFRAPAITVVGEVVKLRRELNWYEALPLLGQRVVVTRTRRQASALTEKLARLGADVLEIPTIRIVPLALEPAQRERLKAMGKSYDWLIFTSPNAADLFFAELFKVTDDLRTLGAIRIAAVGPATTRKLAELHLRVDLQPKSFTVEELSSCFSREMAAQARFCVPHGRLASPALANHVRAHGGEVDEWILYDTEPEKSEPSGARERYLKEGAQWITFTSSSTVENWHALKLKPSAGTPEPEIISMGPMTTETLRKLDYDVAAEAPHATLESLVETICEMREKQKNREIRPES